MSRPHPPAGQRGIALVIALVLIFAISLLGISVMRGSALDMRLAANATAGVSVFQAAESAVDAAFADESNLVAASASEGEAVALDIAPLDAVISLETSIEHTSTGMAPGFSVGSGSFRGFRYRVRGTASMAGSDAEARIEQGAVQAAPNL